MTTALKEQGAIRRSAEIVYEPEIHAFGGDDAMGVAHTVFHADGHQSGFTTSRSAARITVASWDCSWAPG